MMRRIEDRLLPAGQGLFVDDIDQPRTSHQAFVRSNWAAASIERIDVAEALVVREVVAVLPAVNNALARVVIELNRVPIRFADVVTAMSLLSADRGAVL